MVEGRLGHAVGSYPTSIQRGGGPGKALECHRLFVQAAQEPTHIHWQDRCL